MTGVMLAGWKPAWPALLVHLPEHLGMGMVVAGVLALLWHTQEMSEFFRKNAEDVILGERYLERLSRARLFEVRSRIADVLVREHVTWRDHEWPQFLQDTETLLFTKCLPGPPTQADRPSPGVYRRDLKNDITVTLGPLKGFLAEIGVSPAQVPAEALDRIVVREETVSQCTIVAPRDNLDYPTFLTLEAQSLPGVPAEKRARMDVAIGELGYEPVPVKARAKDGHPDFFVISAERVLRLGAGETKIRSKFVEFHPAGFSPFILETMGCLTRGLDVRVKMLAPGYRFEGEVFGLGADAEADVTASGLWLKYNGWLLEDHGYVVFWWRST